MNKQLQLGKYEFYPYELDKCKCEEPTFSDFEKLLKKIEVEKRKIRKKKQK